MTPELASLSVIASLVSKIIIRAFVKSDQRKVPEVALEKARPLEKVRRVLFEVLGSLREFPPVNLEFTRKR
ncbi:hypothetical protein TNCV_3070191 [Trichonephila clavipes]|nr:hypothetical protein TNCV_3070191 [Trichonephila clavipes]